MVQGLPPIDAGTRSAAWPGMVAGMIDGGGAKSTPRSAARPMVVGTRSAAWPGMVAGMLEGGVVVTMLLLLPTGPPMVAGTRSAAWLGMLAGMLPGAVPPTPDGLPPIVSGV